LTPKQQAFLAAFARCGSITDAAAAAGVDRTAHYRWKAESFDYLEAFKRAEDEAADVLEDAAIERAVAGWEEPIISRGELVYRRDPETDALELDREGRPIALTIRKRSDALLSQLLKAWKPSKFRENFKVETEHSFSGLASFTDAQLEAIARGSSPGAAAPADSEK
jgi:hypothetical protein